MGVSRGWDLDVGKTVMVVDTLGSKRRLSEQSNRKQSENWSNPAVPANDNERDWLTSLSQAYPTIASLQENEPGSWRGLGGISVVLICAILGWLYILAESVSSFEGLLN